MRYHPSIGNGLIVRDYCSPTFNPQVVCNNCYSQSSFPNGVPPATGNPATGINYPPSSSGGGSYPNKDAVSNNPGSVQQNPFNFGSNSNQGYLTPGQGTNANQMICGTTPSAYGTAVEPFSVQITAMSIPICLNATKLISYAQATLLW